MKLSGWILRVSLIVMIALSLVFSLLIWQNPSRLGRQETATTVKSTTDTAVGKQTEYLFTPTAAYYRTAGEKRLLLRQDETVFGQIHRLTRTWRPTAVGKATKLSAAGYTAALEAEDSLQLTFSGPISFATFNAHYFNHRLKGATDFQFNRLAFDLSGSQAKVSLLNDSTRTKRTLSVAKVSDQKLRQTVMAARTTGLPVTEQRLNGRMIASFTQSIRVSPYAFLLDQQNANHFVSLLMPTSQSNAVDSREIGSELIYTLGDRYRLNLNDNDNTMQFEDSGTRTKSKSLTTALNRGYQAITKLNLQGVNTMHYFGYDKTTQTVTFRSYAQGLPIFNDIYNGTVDVSSTSSGLTMSFSLNNLTVAIPTKQAAVTLPSTGDVLAQFAHAGYSTSTIQDVQLGYYWKPQTGNSQVVDLTPTYFVEINHQYKRYTEWLLPSTAAQAQESTAQSVQ